MTMVADVESMERNPVTGIRHGGIFATPTEPIFTVKPHGMNADLLESWLIILAEENMHRVASTSKQVVNLSII